MSQNTKEAAIDKLNKHMQKMLEEVMSGAVKKLDVASYKQFRQQAYRLSREGPHSGIHKAFTAEQADKAMDVQENIRMRAKMREHKSLRFPNIASILTGGAQSPISGINQMQKAASMPFRAVSEFKKAQAERGKFQEEMEVKTWESGGSYELTQKEEKRLNRLKGEEEGAEDRAKKGVSGQLMGRRMQSMIGKVGKFMESGTGQGMLAGGMMGASILTMVIKKAMEASPMLQQMMKIMNVAMTLFLRPIGDFIGGMLKPIMLFFLREIAIPMLQKGKNFIRFGEQFGKQLLGFLLKPIDTIYTAITLALDKNIPFLKDSERKKFQSFDGMKEWQSEQKLQMLALSMNISDFTQITALLRGDIQAMSGQGGTIGMDGLLPGAQGPQTLRDLAAMGGDAGGNFLDQFKAILAEQTDNSYTTINKMTKISGVNTNVASGMGAVSSSFDTLNTATADLVSGFQGLIDLIPGATAEDPIPTNTGETQGPPIPDNLGDPAQVAHWSDISVYDTLQKMYAAANDQIRKGLQSEAGSAEHMQAMKEYTELTGSASGPGSISVLEGMKRKFKGLQEAMDRAAANAGIELEYREDLVDSAIVMTTLSSLELHQAEYKAKYLDTANKTNEDSTKKSVASHLSIAQMLGDGWVAVSALLARIAAIRAQRAYASSGGQGGGRINFGFGAGGGDHRGTGSNLDITSGHFGSVDTSHGWGEFQHGGMINEPIFGIGKSGQRYMFGEAGPERIIPTGASTRAGGGTGEVTINVNVDSINSDVDLEKIKPIVERALQEVHARRGII